MRTSGIKIDIDKSDKLLLDNSEKIEKIIKFAVRQATLQYEKAELKTLDSKNSEVKKIEK
jgi:hypothetical protein